MGEGLNSCVVCYQALRSSQLSSLLGPCSSPATVPGGKALVTVSFLSLDYVEHTAPLRCLLNYRRCEHRSVVFRMTK